jgi:predicted Zn-dependent protease
MLALARSEPDVAIARIEEARRLQPSNAIYAKMVAAIHRSAGRYSEAFEMSEQAAELQPGNPQLALEAARDAIRVIGGRDNLGRAIRWFDEVARIDPLGPGRGEAANFFEAIGRHDRAEEIRSGRADVSGSEG